MACRVDAACPEAVQAFAHQSGRKRTGLGWAFRAVFCGQKVHRNRSLHLGNLRILPRWTPIEGGEGGGICIPCFGRKRNLPRFHQFLVHFRDERAWPGVTVIPQVPIVKPRAFGMRQRIPHKPDLFGCPFEHDHYFSIRDRLRLSPRRGLLICGFSVRWLTPFL